MGELTRGMLVVDRRDDIGAYAPGANRAEVQAELDRHHFQHTGAYESTAVPAQVEVESPPPRPPTFNVVPPNSISSTSQQQQQAFGVVTASEANTPTASAGGQSGANSLAGGVPCVTRTPGPAALVKLLLERVWGVKP